MCRLVRVVVLTFLVLFGAAASALASLKPIAVATDATGTLAEVSLGSQRLLRPLSTAVPRTSAGETYGVRAWIRASGHPAGQVVLTVRERRGRRTVRVRSVAKPVARSQLVSLTFRARRHGDSVGISLRAVAPSGARERVSVTRVRLALLTPKSESGTSSSTGGAPCPQTFGAFSTTNQPPACWRPYGDNSPMNEQLPANPRLYPKSHAIVEGLVQNDIHFEDGPDGFALVTPGRQPIYWSSSSDPTVTIECTYYWGQGTCHDHDGRSLDGTTIHIPAGAEPEHATDRRMSVIDQTNHVEYDFDHATWSSDRRTLTTYSAGSLKIGTADAPGFGNGTTAGSLGNLAGIITPSELLANQINHALSISLPCTRGYVWPASTASGFDCSGIPGQHEAAGAIPAPIGALFQLNMSDAQIAATGAPRWEQAIMRAMAHYGLYVNDTNGAGDPHSIETELTDDLTYTSFGRRAQMGDALKELGGSYYAPLSRWILAGLPIGVDKLRVVDPCVKRGTCS